MSMILMTIKKSSNSQKKLMAIFKNKVTGRTKTVHFGATGYSDYTLIKNKEEANKKRNLYLKRHSKNENWNNPMTAGSLSRWVLWGDSQDINKNIVYFKNKFNLN